VLPPPVQCEVCGGPVYVTEAATGIDQATGQEVTVRGVYERDLLAEAAATPPAGMMGWAWCLNAHRCPRAGGRSYAGVVVDGRMVRQANEPDDD
jgi:hypothetical protein